MRNGPGIKSPRLRMDENWRGRAQRSKESKRHSFVACREALKLDGLRSRSCMKMLLALFTGKGSGKSYSPISDLSAIYPYLPGLFPGGSVNKPVAAKHCPDLADGSYFSLIKILAEAGLQTIVIIPFVVGNGLFRPARDGDGFGRFPFPMFHVTVGEG